jgi:hypothetical protein
MLVIGRNTAFTYKGKAVDLRQIGRELNVRYVLEGSVQRAGSRMGVNVQLVDAETGNHLWAERFDKPLADLFDMQDEIVARVANALMTQIEATEARRAERASNPDAIDLYFQGTAWFNKGPTPEHMKESARVLRTRAGAGSRQCLGAGRHGACRCVRRRRSFLRRPRRPADRGRGGSDQGAVLGARVRHGSPMLGPGPGFNQPLRPSHCRVQTGADAEPKFGDRSRVYWSRKDLCRSGRGNGG